MLIVDHNFDKERHAYQRNVLAQVTSGEIVAVRTVKALTLIGFPVVSPVTSLPVTFLEPVKFAMPGNVRTNEIIISTAEAAVQLGWYWFVRQN